MFGKLLQLSFIKFTEQQDTAAFIVQCIDRLDRLMLTNSGFLYSFQEKKIYRDATLEANRMLGSIIF